MGSIVNTIGFSIGSVETAFSNETQFQAQKGTGWVLADGRDVTGSKYASLFSTTLPDMRGGGTRASNDGGSPAGARSDGKQNPDGTKAPGTYESDGLGPHTHGGSTNSDGAHSHNQLYFTQSGGHTHFGGPTGIAEAPTGTVGPSSVGWAPGTHSHGFTTGNPSNGGNDNRVKTTTINYFIRIN